MVDAIELNANDARSSEALIELALTAPDEDAKWNIVPILQQRGSWTEFELSAQLAASEEPQKRCLGANILGQLGTAQPTYRPESIAILMPLLDDQDIAVVEAAVYALGHRRAEQAILPISRLSDHPEPDVRHSVAFALGGFDDDIAIATLLKLCADRDDDTRNWATFAIASLTDRDTPEIRAVLLERMQEADGEIRGEALVGLARRQDEGAIDWVRQELGREFAGSWVLEAAEWVGDASIVPLLEVLGASWGAENQRAFGEELEGAIEACRNREMDKTS
jgi:HEAT repeat protein